MREVLRKNGTNARIDFVSEVLNVTIMSLVELPAGLFLPPNAATSK
jgi:hypothetical protein